jgi:hypothetical protein
MRLGVEGAVVIHGSSLRTCRRGWRSHAPVRGDSDVSARHRAADEHVALSASLEARVGRPPGAAAARGGG